MVKVTLPERFIAGSPIGERIKDVFENNLAEGALRLVTINGEAQPLRKLGNNEAKVAEVVESGYFGILQSNPDFIEAEIADLVIDVEDVPESYFELQRRIARERGHGDIEFTEGVKDETIATLQDDQTESLIEWADYLRSEENGHIYPDWFKVYAWESLKKMGDFDKEKGEFKKRTKSTTAPWPELNAEALAYVYDAIDTSVIGGGPSEGRLQQLLKAGNFSKLYAHAITEVGVGGSPELREITKGSWVKYDQIEGKYAPDYTVVDGEYTDDKFVDNPTVIALTDSLRGMGTGWCTAGTRTAAHQLSMGDFYVYYTQDEEGEDTIPRIAIRMEDDVVAEVRGIEPDQNLEGNMADIVAEKLAMLSGGDTYFEKVENMKRLTEIDERVKAGGELTADDIIFLRFSGTIEGFGWDADPRIGELLKNRSLDDDLTIAVQGCASPTKLANELIDTGNGYFVAENIKSFADAGVNPAEIANGLINESYYGACVVAESIKSFADAGVNPSEVAITLISTGQGYLVIRDIEAFLSAGVNPSEVAIALIRGDYEHIYDVACNLKAFLAASVSPAEFARVFINASYGDVVARNLKVFAAAGVNPAEIANGLIGRGYAYVIAENLYKFLNTDINPTSLANRLISAGYGDVVADDLGAFLAAGAEIDPTKLADELIDSGKDYFVVVNLGAFLAAGAEIDPTKLANELIDSGNGSTVAYGLDALVTAGAEIDLTKLARSLVDARDGSSIACNSNIFAAAITDTGIDPTSLAGALIYASASHLVAENLGAFLAAGANPTNLTNRLISAGYGGTVARNIEALIAAGVDRGYLEAILKTPE